MLRAAPQFRTTPIIICTALLRAADELADQLTDPHIAIVFKPFDIEELVQQVATMLD